MSLAQAIVALYGVFTFVGGMIGFIKAKSAASLIAGSVSGILLLICAYGMKGGHVIFYLAAAAVSLLLGIRFFGTWRVKKKLMPDFLMVVFSLISLIVISLEVMK